MKRGLQMLLVVTIMVGMCGSAFATAQFTNFMVNTVAAPIHNLGYTDPVTAGQKAAGGNFVVVFNDFVNTDADGLQDGSFQLYDSNYNAIGGNVRINSALTKFDRASVAMDGAGGFVTAWGDGVGIKFATFNSAGVATSPETTLAGTDPLGAWPTDGLADVAMNKAGTSFVVTYNGLAQNVKAQQYTLVAGVWTAGVPWQVNGPATTGSSLRGRVAIDDAGDIAVTWSSGGAQYLQRYNPAGVPIYAADNKVSIANVGTASDNPSAVAMNPAGEVIVTWFTGANVYFQRYNAAGVAVGGETIANAGVIGPQTSGVELADNGDFVVIWSMQTTLKDIQARRFLASGAAVDAADFYVNVPQNAGREQNATIGMTADGNSLVAWNYNNRETAPGSNANRLYDNYAAGFQIPEPATMSLLALAGLAMLRRRK